MEDRVGRDRAARDSTDGSADTGGRAGLVLGIVVGVLVLVAVVAAVLAAMRPDPQLPAGSPEATVQDYVRLVYAHDLDEAAALLDPQGRCAKEDLESAWVDREARMVLRESDVDGDEADVRVDLVYAGGGPFGLSDEYSEPQHFQLARAGERWVITGEPWPMYGCAPGAGERP